MTCVMDGPRNPRPVSFACVNATDKIVMLADAAAERAVEVVQAVVDFYSLGGGKKTPDEIEKAPDFWIKTLDFPVGGCGHANQRYRYLCFKGTGTFG